MYIYIYIYICLSLSLSIYIYIYDNHNTNKHTIIIIIVMKRCAANRNMLSTVSLRRDAAAGFREATWMSYRAVSSHIYI